MGWPERGQVDLRYIFEGSPYYPHEIRKISLLGTDEPITWNLGKEHLTIEFPNARPPACDHAYAFKIEPK